MKYVLRNETVIENCIAEIRQSLGKTVEIKDTKRSNQQNALMWMLITAIAKETGYTPDALHETLKVRWLGVNKRIVEGIELVEANSTTKLTKPQFGEYIDKIYALGAELNIQLPDPSYWGLECTD